jgi:hypothetical protein
VDIHTLSEQMGNSAAMIEGHYSKLIAMMPAERLARGVVEPTIDSRRCLCPATICRRWHACRGNCLPLVDKKLFLIQK